MNMPVHVEIIATKILEVRGKKVISDRELARLYGVETRRLNEQVKRNIKRFPGDFCFKLTKEEVYLLRSQFATLNAAKSKSSKRGRHIKYLPYVFTEQGVAMLSSVLNSERAIMVNIQIMRAFVKLKELLLTHKELTIRLGELENKYVDHDEKIRRIFEAIKQLLKPPKVQEKRVIGFGK